MTTRRPRPFLRSGAAKPRASRVEDGLQESMVSYYRAAVAASPTAPLLLAIANGEGRTKATAGRLVGLSGDRRAHLSDDEAMMPFGLGVLPGAVDMVLICGGGRVCWIEVKRPEDKARGHRAGKMSRMQRLFAGRLQTLGHRHVVLESLDEFAVLLMSYGLKLRVRYWGPEVVKPGTPPRLPTGDDVSSGQ